VVTGSVPNNKSDLTHFYVASQVINDEIILNLAWERASDTGNANMDFEFNQSEVLSANGMTPVRTVGDMLITFDFGGGGTVELGLRMWDGSAWGASVDLDASGFASGAVSSDKLFGEASINLTDTNVFPPDQCLDFGGAFVKSRSSTSFSAEMKDFIAPIPVNIDNCPDVVVHKTVGTTGTSQVGTIEAGDTVVFTLVVTNAGMGTAHNVVLSDILPDGVVWTVDAPVGVDVSIVNGILVGNFGDMASGESITITVSGEVAVDDCGKILNEATVSADHEDDVDNNRGAALYLVNPVLTQDDYDWLAGIEV
jgi:uncharacterized repeat protein (TIGR01451 family)